jgi:hypothetical protein
MPWPSNMVNRRGTARVASSITVLAWVSRILAVRPMPSSWRPRRVVSRATSASRLIIAPRVSGATRGSLPRRHRYLLRERRRSHMASHPAFARRFCPCSGLWAHCAVQRRPTGPSSRPTVRHHAADSLEEADRTRLHQLRLCREHYSDFLREVGAGIAAGRIRYREDIVDGLENAPGAFIRMLEGRNFGKLIVRVAA